MARRKKKDRREQEDKDNMQEVNILHENEKRYLRFNGFGEMLFWSYANLQMLVAANNMGKATYDRQCYMIRAKAFKAYKEGRWLRFNKALLPQMGRW